MGDIAFDAFNEEVHASKAVVAVVAGGFAFSKPSRAVLLVDRACERVVAAVCDRSFHRQCFGFYVCWHFVGDVTNASGNEAMLQEKGIQVDILEDQKGIELYAQFRAEKPDQDLEDWQGLSAVLNEKSDG